MNHLNNAYLQTGSRGQAVNVSAGKIVRQDSVLHVTYPHLAPLSPV